MPRKEGEVRLLALCAALTVGVVLSWPVAAEAAPAKASRKQPESPASLRRKVQARMESLDFEAALPLLKQLLASPELSPRERAEAQVDLAITYVNLGENQEAVRAFKAALESYPDVGLPAGTSPKIRRLYEEAREARIPPKPPVKPEVAQPAPPPPAVKVERPVVAAPAVTQPAPGGRNLTLPAVAFGVAAAAGLVGAGAATLSNGTARELQSALHDTREADALVQRHGAFATTAYASYALAGIAAVTGVALLAFGPGQDKVAVGATLTGSGGVAAIAGRF